MPTRRDDGALGQMEAWTKRAPPSQFGKNKGNELRRGASTLHDFNLLGRQGGKPQPTPGTKVAKSAARKHDYTPLQETSVTLVEDSDDDMLSSILSSEADDAPEEKPPAWNPIIFVVTFGQAPEWLMDVNSDSFNIVIGCVITFNAIIMYFETDYGNSYFKFFEHFFCIFFLIEMSSKLCQLGLYAYATDAWCAFDGTLVVMGTIDLYVLTYVIHGKKNSAVAMLRMLRMLRVMRILRLFKIFRELSLILAAFLRAFESVMWVGVLTLLVDYICAVLLTKVIGHHTSGFGENEDKMKGWFGSVGNSMRTLFIIMTLAEFDDILKICQMHMDGLLVFTIMASYVVFAAFTMVALITGIICEALMSARQDDEENKMEEIREERKAFRQDLTDALNELGRKTPGLKEGCVRLQDVKKALSPNGSKGKKLVKKLRSLDIELTLGDIQDLLDKMPIEKKDPMAVDDGELINTVEFVSAMEQRQGDAKASHVWDLKHHIKILREHQDELATQLDWLDQNVKDLLQQV